MAQMDDLTLASIVKNRVSDAIGLSGDQLSQDRMDAMKYYRGEKFGNERDGRSQVVSRDVAEAVDGILPGLIKIFMSGDEIVRYEPRGPEDEANCKQATPTPDVTPVTNTHSPARRCPCTMSVSCAVL